MLVEGLSNSFMTKMSAKRHLRELQWRLMIVAAFFIVGATLAYQFQKTLIPFLLDPLHGEKLVYLNPAGGFIFIFLVSIYSGIALAFPVFMQQLYAFLRPALPEAARKKSAIIIICSFLLLFAGLAFGYFVAVPNALAFLYGFADQFVEASLTADSYLNFIIAYTIGIGIVFQLPLLLLLIHTVRPLTPGGLGKSEKWVILLAFIVAAIITPTPDPINQAIIAGPVIVVYQIGVVAVLIAISRTASKKRRVAKQVAKFEKQQQLATQSLPVPVTTPAIASLAEAPIASPVIAPAEPIIATKEISAPQVQQKPTLAPSPAFKPVDGFTRRPITTRPIAQAAPIKKLQPTPQPMQRPITSRGFSMDGMTMPKRATSF